MNLEKIYKNIFVVMFLSFVLTSCATQTTKVDSQMQGDVYTGTDTVEYLADGVQIEFSLQQMNQFLRLLPEKL